MRFRIRYPGLFQFFGGYFPDADFEDITDEEVVLRYVSDCSASEISKQELERTIREIEDLIVNIEEYWQEVGEEANRYFKTSHDALEWLSLISRELQKNR